MPPRSRSAPRYPIRAVARLTGITVDTLRAWERRYGVVSPSRDERGRLYSDTDVRRLQLLAAALDRGHAIGRVAPLSDDELQDLLAAPVAPAAGEGVSSHPDAPLRPLMAAIEAFDHQAIERELNRLALALLPRDLIRRVVLPVMRQVGDNWHAKRLTVAQEHMVSAALRNLLGALVRLHTREHPPRRMLFAAPSGERHEFGILAGAMLAAAGGLGVLYVGADLPALQIVEAATRGGVDVTVLGAVYRGRLRDTDRELQHVAAHLPATMELWLGGAALAERADKFAAPNLVMLPDFETYEVHLARIGARF